MPPPYTNGQPVIIRLTVLDAHDSGKLVLGAGPEALDHLILSEADLEAIEVGQAASAAGSKLVAYAGAATRVAKRVRAPKKTAKRVRARGRGPQAA